MEFLSLILLVLLPIIGTIIIFGPWFPQNEVKIRRFAKGWAGFIFLYSLFFIAFFNNRPDFFSDKRNEWVEHD